MKHQHYIEETLSERGGTKETLVTVTVTDAVTGRQARAWLGARINAHGHCVFYLDVNSTPSGRDPKTVKRVATWHKDWA